MRSSPRSRIPRHAGSPIALTGTPGTGKTAVAARLSPTLRSIEVADLAVGEGAGRRRGRTVTVDLARLATRLRRLSPPLDVDLVVGHLAHLLPFRDVIVLRCHPLLLERRLRRARRGSSADRAENVGCEATDVVLLEAVGPGRRVWEIDTTGRSVDAIAHAVLRRVRRRGASAYGTIDWLADPAVTEHLLDRSS